jgi:diguanylate cyclase (GGDEF)-like protein
MAEVRPTTATVADRGDLTPGAQSQSHEASDLAFMCRVSAAMLLLGAGTRLATLPLPDSDASNHAAIAAIAGLLALGAVVVWTLGRERRSVLRISAIYGIFLISALVAVTRPIGPTPFFYLWPVLFSAYFFSRRQVAIDVAIVWVTLGLALLLWSGVPARETMLIGVGVSVTLTAVVVTLLRERLTTVIGQLAEASVNSRREAHTDDLTGLANRRRFYELLQRAIAGASARSASFALLLIDLDGFKELNDTLGHYAGDLLLQQIGPRLQGVLRSGEALARLGGDEFALILRDADASEPVARRVDSALQRPFELEGLSIAIRASIGIAVFPGDAQDADGLMQRADVAMYQAKQTRTVFEFYLPGRDTHTPERLALAAELPSAIERGDLVLDYQPKVDVSTGRACGVEALVHWQHPERGRIPPDDFIPIAEQTGIMRELTAAVLDQALGQLSTWLAEGRELTMAVNVSVSNLLDAGFVVDLRWVLERWRTPTQALQLEITENVLMADRKQAIGVLNAIAALGVGISLDDFGTGFSPLAYLREFAADEIKIDRSFVATMIDDPTAATIVASTIQLAGRLGMRVVAEGVETGADLDLLRSFGCQLMQGYYFSKPLPPHELERWMDASPQRSTEWQAQAARISGEALSTLSRATD